MTPRVRVRPWMAGIVLPVAVLLGIALRLAPCLRDPGFDFVVDAGYHERLTREVVAAGRLADVDRLSNAPEGRRTAHHLPVGLYRVGAAAHRVLSTLGSRDLRWNLAFLMALVGALIAVPAWIGANAVFHDPRAAALAALVSVFLPAHLQRTHGFYLRYDGLGTLLVVLHLALALATLSESSRAWRRWAFALGSAAALVAALWVWRLGLFVFEIELAFAVLRFVVRGAEPAPRDLWCVLAVAGTLGLLPVAYLSRHGFLISPAWLGAAGLGLALALPVLRPGSRWWLRLAALAAIGAAAVLPGRLGAGSDYAGLPGTLAARLGLARAHDPAASLLLGVQELAGTSLRDLLAGPRVFFVLGACLLVSPALFWWLAGRPPLRRVLELDAAPAALAFAAAALGVSTLLFERTSVLLAPLAAMVAAGLLARAWPPRAAVGDAGCARSPAAPAGQHGRTRGRRRAARSATRPRSRGTRWLGAALGLGVLATMVTGVIESATSWSHLDRNEKAAIEFLRTHAARDAIVLSDWDAGYDVQNRAGLATVVDGLLESAENRRRIIETYAALMDRSPSALERLCARYRARWLLMPPGSAIYSMAAVTGDPLAAVLARREPVPPGPFMDHVVVHLIAGDVAYPGFRRAFEAGGFQVFEFVGGSRLR